MAITVKFFARLREELGMDEVQLDFVAGLTTQQVWQNATRQEVLPAKTLVAINQQYASEQSLVKDNDEVAFFPPVTGG